MLQFLEKKLGTTIHTFFGFGLLCFALGFLVIISEFLWKFLMALLFLIVAFALLHVAYRLQLFREHMHHFFGNGQGDGGVGIKKSIKQPVKKSRVL